MSFVVLETKDIWSLESNLSFVCPANCGFCNFEEIIKIELLITSSAFIFNPFGSKFLISQNSFNDSRSPDLKPFKWEPPCNVGIKFTYVSSNLFYGGLNDQFIANSNSWVSDFFEHKIESSRTSSDPSDDSIK